jgi:opine dehydrogenase
MTHIAILGAGNAGAALAAHLKLMGQTISLYDAFPAALADIQANKNVIHLQGNSPVTGDARIDLVTGDLAEAVRSATILICATPAHVHRLLAHDIAPHLSDDQSLVLYPGRTGGVLEFRKVLSENGCQSEPLIVETQTIAYACRKTGASVNVFGYKHELSYCGMPAHRLPTFQQEISPIFPNWVQAESLWHTSIHNIGMLFHPAPTLLNLGRMESGVPFDYYIEGFTPSIAGLVEQMDSERLQVAESMGLNLPSVRQWVLSSYGAEGKNLYEQLQNNQSYVGIKAPQLSQVDDKLKLRYVIEDVPTGLVPVAALGSRFQVATPTINSIIDLANAMYGTDFRANGRNLNQLGLSDLTTDQIKMLNFKPPARNTGHRW